MCAWQRTTFGWAEPLAIAQKCFDDLQRRSRLAFGAFASEVGSELPIRAEDFLISDVVVSAVRLTALSFARSHQSLPNLSLRSDRITEEIYQDAGENLDRGLRRWRIAGAGEGRG